MPSVPTVRIAVPGRETPVRINREDFDSETHVLWEDREAVAEPQEESPEEPSQEEEPADEDATDEAEE